MTRVGRREGESFASLLKRFRKKVARARILSTVGKRRHFVSDAEKRQLAWRKAVRRQGKRQRRMQRRFGRA